MIRNETRDLGWEDFEAILASAARLLVYRGDTQEAAILASAIGVMETVEDKSWDITYQVLTLGIPVEAYLDLHDKDKSGYAISDAVVECAKGFAGFNRVDVIFRPRVAETEDWRQQVKAMVSGEGITNQGRAHSSNVAPISYRGLLFRSPPEVEFFKALLETGVPIAPLSVVVAKRQRNHRIEPDFVVYYGGKVMVIELDGPGTHKETPQQAAERLEFLTDQGCIVWRVDTAKCSTSDQAWAEVKRALQKVGWKPPSPV